MLLLCLISLEVEYLTGMMDDVVTKVPGFI